MSKNKLTREEYAKKFEKLFAKLYYIPQAGEEIVQCKDQYPSYWFISNKGYLFSVYTQKIKILTPNFDRTGKTNQSGERAGMSWRYGTRLDKPQRANLTRYDMSKLIADHFKENEFTSDEDTEIHHISKKMTYSEDEAQKCNSADNLQILPKSVHRELTRFAGKTESDFNKELKNKLSGRPVYAFTEEGLEQFLIQAIRSCLANGVEPVIYTTTITDDVSQIKGEAHPIKSKDILGL